MSPSHGRPARLLLVVPLIVAGLVMVPRLLSPTFGLLDDGFTLRGIRQGVSIVVASLAPTGRFMPAYWVFYSAVRALVGPSPLGFFLVNALMLGVLAVGLAFLLGHAGASRLQAMTAAILLISSGPALETFYTLSKAEPPQLLWLLASLGLMAAYSAAASIPSKVLVGLGLCMVLLVADATKETSLAMVPIAVAWMALAWWGRERTGPGPRLAALAVYTLAALLAAGAFLGWRAWAIARPLEAGWYTAHYRLDGATTLRGLAYWAMFLARDFGYLVPLVLGLALVAVASRKRPRGRLVTEALVWMAGWMAVFLPWGWAADYYLLPFSLGCVAVGATLLGEVVDVIRTARGATRAVAVASLAMSGVLWVLSLLSAIGNAGVQLAVDAANTEMMAFLTTLPRDSTVMINVTKEHEYYSELGIHLSELRGRSDIRVDVGSPTPAARGGAVYVLTPHVAGRPHPSMRLPFDESTVRPWPLPGDTGKAGERVYETRHRVRLVDVGLHHLLCRLVPAWQGYGDVCRGDTPLIDARPFFYGWALYRLSV